MHFDQNEKLAMYGVTHVMAVDGFSRKIVGMITIPVKNSVAIYHTLMQPLLHQYGLWQQVRTDHGTEFALIGSDCTAVSSTTSTMARSFPCPAEHITPKP